MDDKKPLLDFRRTRIVKGANLLIYLPRAERVRAARGVRQAVVKVVSYAHGVKRAKQLMDYISREGTLELETESGELVRSLDQQKELVQTWSRDFDQRKDSRDTAHIVFSMPPGSNPEALRNAVRSVGKESFQDNEWVFGIHQDTKHPHAHMVIKMRGRERDKKLRLNKPELYKLREVFAKAAREQGVELAASPRAARGIGRKGMRQAIYQLRHKGIKPEVERQTVKEAIQELTRGDWKEKPWERAMGERNKMEREAYRQEAAALRQEAEQEPQEENRARMLKDARVLEQFAERMPKPKTKRQAIKERMWQKVQEQRREKARVRDQGAEMER